MIRSRPTFGKIFSSLLVAAFAALTLQCGGGDDGGGVTPPTEPTIALSRDCDFCRYRRWPGACSPDNHNQQ